MIRRLEGRLVRYLRGYDDVLTRRSAWAYENSPPLIAVLKAHNIEVEYIDPRSGGAAQACSTLRANGITPGLCYAPNWNPGLTPQAHAKIVSDYVQHGGMILPGEPVMVDLELLSPVWVTAFLKKLRAYLPTRPLSYTNCPFQNETVVPVDALKKYGLHWFPQLYYGPSATDSMPPADGAAVILEVCRIFDPAKVHPFYDAARLPADWRDGAIFTQERLPLTNAPV